MILNEFLIIDSGLPNIKLNSVVPVASFRSMSALSSIYAAVMLPCLTCSIMMDFNGHETNSKGNSGKESLPASLRALQTQSKIWWVRLFPNPVGNSANTSLPSTIFWTIKLCSCYICRMFGNDSNAEQTPCSKNSIMQRKNTEK